MNISSVTPWLSDFHTVQFSVSSGCFFVFKFAVVLLLVVRGGSVSTYASILAGRPFLGQKLSISLFTHMCACVITCAWLYSLQNLRYVYVPFSVQVEACPYTPFYKQLFHLTMYLEDFPIIIMKSCILVFYLLELLFTLSLQILKIFLLFFIFQFLFCICFAYLCMVFAT